MNVRFRRLLAAAVPAVLIGGSVSLPAPAQAVPPAAEALLEQAAIDEQLTTSDFPVMPQDVGDLPELDVPDGEVDVDREANRATEQIDPLAPLDPATGSPDVPIEAVEPDPPVRPESLELPTSPAQDLVDATAADALDTLAAADRLGEDGTPDLDAGDLQPQVASAQVVDGTVPATVEELLEALLSGDLPPDLGVDPLALLEQLPDGIPRITYRVCSESATKAVSCSLTLPLGVPAIVDATGDGTPDVLADLLPAAALDDVVPAALEVIEIQGLLDETQTSLENLLELIQDPLWLIQNPWAIVEAANLENLVEELAATLEDKVAALLDIVHVGLAMLEVRLPTSEFHGEDLPAHVWAVYDIPGANRLSVGYDGYRRGDSLSTATLGVFTFAPFSIIAGEYDISATLVNVGAGDSLAVTAGLASVADTDEGEALDPTVASARFSPVPTVFDVEAEVKPATDTEDQIARVDSGSDVATHLDAIVLANDRTSEDPSDRFVQASVDQVPTDVSAQLTWTETGDRAVLDYEASSVIDDLLFADFTYADGTALEQAVQARAAALPAAIHADLSTAEAGTVALDYTASSVLDSLDVAYFDLAGEIVLRGGLDALPQTLNLYSDTASGRVHFEGSQALGQARVDGSLGLVEYPPAEGDHATLVTSGADLGFSAQVTGMQLVDAYFDGHPRLTTRFDPGGQEFNAAGDIDGVHKARAHISNLPAEASLDIDTGARQLRYAASEVIDLARIDYTNTESGPTVLAAVHEVPATVALDYTLGDTPRLNYEASSAVPLVEFFASFDHIEQLDPTGDEYLSARIDALPATIDVGIDFPARHLEGTLSSELGGIDVVARFGLEDRVWTGMAALTGVPTEFDADWAAGTIRARGITGAIDSIDLAAGNHADATAPAGLRLAAHYRETTGDIDAAVSTRNLSHIEYVDAGESQSFRLDTDTGGDPVHIDIDVLLADPNDATVDDLQLALLGRVDNLPSSLNVNFSGDRLSYTADRNVGLLLEARLGKVAALDGLGAPLYDNGVAAVARTCETGAGCATAETPFCPDTGCLGLVATVNLPGLPTGVAVDFTTRTVELTGYEPPDAPLQAYVRLIGLIEDLPDLRAEATLTGLPSPVDFTVGPITVGGGSVDVGYESSGPLGNLSLEVNAATTHEDFPILRALATLTGVPQTFALSADLGDRTEVTMTNASPVEELALKVTGDDEGYIDAVLQDIPAEANVVVDVPNSTATGTMSDRLGSIRMLANNMPFDGDTWGAWLDITGVPAGFSATWGGGEFTFGTTGGALSQAAAAVTNHPDALAPAGSHFAVGYRESTGEVDASASIADLTSVSYTTEGDDQHFGLDMASQSIALDANVILAAGGVDDTQLALVGNLQTPDALDVTVEDGRIVVDTVGPNLGAELQARAGKVAALEGLGSPVFDNGVAARVAGCEGGEGCSTEVMPGFCEVLDACLGVVASVHLPQLPDKVTVDIPGQRTVVEDLGSPGELLELFVELEGVLDEVPSTAGLVTLDGLPESLDLTVGPYQFGGEGCRDGTDALRDMCLGYTASEELGSLTARLQADTAEYGEYRGRIDLDPVPTSLDLTGTFGEHSMVSTLMANPIDNLKVQLTAVDLAGIPDDTGSALVQLEDVPARMKFDVFGFSEDSLNAPTFQYNGYGTSTLDGLFEVEADLIAAIPVGDEPMPLAGNAFLSFEDLGAETALGIDELNAITIASEPATANLSLGAGVHTSFSQDLNQVVWSSDCDGAGFAQVRLEGRLSVPTIEIDDLQISVDGLSRLEVRSDPTGAFLGVGFSGTYTHTAVDLGGLLIDPDIDLDLIGSLGGADLLEIDIELYEPVTGTYMHVSDLNWRYAGEIDLGIDFPVFTNPGLLRDPELNHADLYDENGDEPGNGDQVLTYLHLDPFPADLEEETVVLLVQLVTMAMLNPFEPPEEEEPCEEE